MKILKTMVLALTVLSVGAFATTGKGDMSKEAIKERIKPIGSVTLAGAAPAAAAGGARSGADVYAASCIACHGAGVLGAPKLKDAADWAPRMEKGLDGLVTTAINGINAMPPRGTCTNCTDDEIKAAIEHMIEGL